MFDFSVLQSDALPCFSGQDNIEISQRSKDTETLDMPCIVAKKGEFSAVKHGFAPKGLASKPCPFFLVQFQEDILESGPIKRYDCLWFLEDLLPFHFTESGIENTTVVSQGILELSIPCKDVEEGPVRVEEEWYEKTVLLVLDECDITTTTNRALIAQEEDEDVRGSDRMLTRKSTRSRKQVKDSNFVFVYIFMSWSKTF